MRHHSVISCFTRFWARIHVGQSRNEFTWRKVKYFIAVKAIKAPPGCGRPIRMSPELEDDVDRCLLKDEGVKWRATKEGLRLETLQVTKPAFWIFAQKLRRQRGIRTDKCDISKGLRYSEGRDINKPQWAGGWEQSRASWGGHKENLWPCWAWWCGEAPEAPETGNKDEYTKINNWCGTTSRLNKV